jgi:hypothetical protein
MHLEARLRCSCLTPLKNQSDPPTKDKIILAHDQPLRQKTGPKGDVLNLVSSIKMGFTLPQKKKWFLGKEEPHVARSYGD